MTDILPDGHASEDAALDPTDQQEPMDLAEIDPDDEPVSPPPYVFDPSEVADAARVLDHVFATLRSGWEAWGAVEATVTELDVVLTDSCRRALGQIAACPLRMEPRGTPGAELDTGAALGREAVAAVGDDELALWTALIEKVRAPAATARLGELMFARKVPRAHEYARRAAQAYIDAVDSGDYQYDATVHLMRGWTLARQLKDQGIENAALDIMTARLNALMTGEFRERPGAVYPLLQVLCQNPRDTSRKQAQHEHAGAVLSTLAASETHDHLIAETAALRRKLLGSTASDKQRAAVDLDEIGGYCRRAENAPNAAVRLHFLERAAVVATKRGQRNEADRITALMQAIDPDELGLQVITTSSSVPAWIPESALDPYTQAPSWRTGVTLFCTDPCAPTGSVANNRALAARIGKGMLRLPSVLLDRGLPRATLTSDDEQDQHDLSRTAKVWADYQGSLLAAALRRVGDHYGIPELEEVTTALLDLGALDPRMARSLAKGFRYFWAGDYEAAAAVVIPKIETAARALLRDLDEPTFKVQISKVKPGGHIQLHPLLEALEKAALDEDWAYFLRWLLLGPVGRNLRNDYAHGHLDEITPADAALVLRAAAVLITAAPIADDLGRRVQVVPMTVLRTRPARLTESVLIHVKRAAAGAFTAAELLRRELRGTPRQ
ncbi:hypothetical protein IU483_19190 [Streptomyces gardneri]|nr:hypothetical protein [Streptomyces gardneri]